MTSTGLSGPFPLSKEEIINNVTLPDVPGVYALGSMGKGGFLVVYVGRSDSDVHGRLLDHLDSCSHFMFEYYTDPKFAYNRECELYHLLFLPGNTNHPARPKDTKLKCPVCDDSHDDTE